MKFHVIYSHDGKWWTAEAPFLKGAYSQGRTRSSARRHLLGAIRDLLETYEKTGTPPPRSTVEVAIEDLG